MKSNTVYTALELVQEAVKGTPAESLDLANNVIGKVRLSIGGIRGIVDPEKPVNIPSGTDQIEVSFGGDDAFVGFVEFDSVAGEREHSPGARESKDKLGRKVSENSKIKEFAQLLENDPEVDLDATPEQLKKAKELVAARKVEKTQE